MQSGGRPRAVPSEDRALRPCRNTHARRGRQVVGLVEPKNQGICLGSDRGEGGIEVQLGWRALPGGQTPQVDSQVARRGHGVLAPLPGRE